jgi:UDP-N-acetylglucosamine 1-carboxyvinyltransferase
LQGQYTPSGNPNEGIALIAASLLSTQTSHLEACPRTAALQWMLQTVNDLGTQVSWQEDTLHLKTPEIEGRPLRAQEAERPVALTLLLAALLTHRNHASLVWQEPLGRLRTHLTALRDLGMRLEIQGERLSLTAVRWRKQKVWLAETSVTATALVSMLAATLGEETLIYNAACEPHLRSLHTCLMQMGVSIEGIGTNVLRIKGVEGPLAPFQHRILPNHIEIASIAVLAALLGGHVTLQPVIAEDLYLIGQMFQRLGVRWVFEEDKLHVPVQSPLSPSERPEDIDPEIDSAPWFGFPSDLIAMATLVATQIPTTTLIHEKLFNNRLLFTDKLKAMGAQIVLADPHRAIVLGPTPLKGEYLDSPDPRTGLALLGAGLCAEGTTIIDRAELLEHHFESLIHKLQALGAQIQMEGA